MSGNWISTPWIWNWVNVIEASDSWFLDACSSWLPTWNTKTQVDKILSNKEEWDKEEWEIVVEKILSWEYTFFSKWVKGRYIDESFWYYIYTFVLDKNWQKENVDVIFYSTTNSKVMIRVGCWFYEVLISENPQILNMISKIYPLPVYTEDGFWWVSLVNNILD